MSTPFSITINGSAAVTTQSLNLAFAGLELANMSADSAALKWARRRAVETCPIAHNDTVEIFRQGRRLFRGRARLGAITADGVAIRLVGPWSHLEEQIYQLSLVGTVGSPEGWVLGATFAVLTPAGTVIWNGTGWYTLPSDHTITYTISHRSYYAGYPATTAEVDVNMAWTSRCWLFRPGGSLGHVYTTISAEWARVMAFMAATNAPDLFAVGTVELGNPLAPKFRTIIDTTAAAALRQVLAMKPDAAVWWDYAAEGLPTINVRVASLETPVVLHVGSSAGHVLSGYQVRVLDDLVPSGVVVRWERDADETTGLGRPYLADYYPGMEVLTGCVLTTGSASIACDSTANLTAGMTLTNYPGIAGVAITAVTGPTTFTVGTPVSGSASGLTLYAMGATGPASYQPGVLLHTVDEECPVAAGLAKEIYASLAVRRGQGSLSVLDRDFSMGLRPGMVIALPGDAMLSGVQLWVQSVSWSPDTGIAQLTVGYPAHLQLRDRVDLRGWIRVTFSGPWWSYTQIVPPP